MTTKNWNEFRKNYPHADFSKFEAYSKGINYKPTPYGISHDVFINEVGGSIHHYLGQLGEHMIYSLGKNVDPKTIHKETVHVETVHEQPSNFPKQLTYNNVKYPIPAFPFNKNDPEIPDPRAFLTELDIYVSETERFTIKVRDVFKETRIKHVSGEESRRWLRAPSMAYWTQQLNAALWMATSGCGIGYQMLLDDDSRGWSPMIAPFLRFHVAYTTRRILFELGGLGAAVPLPDDSAFSQTDNHWDKPSWERLRNEFELDKGVDFRYSGGSNSGLGDIFVYGSYSGAYKQSEKNNNYPDFFKFSDEGGNASSGNLIYYIQNDVEHPYLPFITEKGKGMTKQGLARLNRSIEAYVYCVLGAQVNTRSSIVGNSGSAQETQQEFLVLFESSIIENDITKSIQRYQLSIQEAKVKLDLAISPECWLLPSNMVLNRESVLGYNNKLQKADSTMRFGVNDINNETKNVGVITMEGHKPKTVLPHIEKHQPEVNPIIDKHKKVIPKKPIIGNDYKNDTENENHKKLKIGLLASAIGIGYYFFR